MSIVEADNSSSTTPKNENRSNNQTNKENQNNTGKPKYNPKRNFNSKPGYSKGHNRQDKNLNINKEAPKNPKNDTTGDNVSQKNINKIDKVAFSEGNSESIQKKPRNEQKEIKISNENKQNSHPKQRSENFRNNRRDKHNYVKPEETADDIRKDMKRIEKEIELEIKEISALKLGL